MNFRFTKALLAVAMAASIAGCSAKTADSTQSAGAETAETGVVRDTAFGKVKGVDNGTDLVWYGIPYGASPVDELRWQAPQDPAKWSDELDCTEAGEVAIQYSTDSETKETTAIGTDDCLNLDVYSTKDAKDLPVLVYIHGGNNQSGNAQEIEGNEIVVRDNCVYVSLTYRLGLLGFNCLPALLDEDNNTGNFTMLDIAKGLDWVKENISNFGGDPNNITVSGFSAGGRDVMAMLISPVFKGKFDKAIAFSGGMTTADPEVSAEKIASLMAKLVVEDGKAKDETEAKAFLLEDTDEVKDYLYSISSDRLASAVGNASIRMSAFPHHYTDGVVLPENGYDGATYNDVPLLMLTGTTEFSFFNNFDGSFYQIEDEDLRNTSVAYGNKYGSDMYRIFNAEMSAEKMYDSYKSNIYVAEVNFGSETSPSEVPMFGAFHGIFVPMLADTNGYTSIFDFQSAKGYVDMGTQFNAYLSNFLRTGDPNGDDLVEWKNWTPEEKLSQVFDADDEKAIIESKNTATTYDAIMDAMDKDDTLTKDQKKFVNENSLNGRWFSAAVEERYNTPDLWK